MNADVLRISERPALVRDQGFERLRDAIISGHFAPGQRLVERELCEAMGISRTSIREVLRRLEAQRLVHVEPRRGPTVARLTLKQATEIYEIRGLLEGILFRSFTECASEAEVAKLREIYEKAAAAGRRDDALGVMHIMTGFVVHVLTVVDHEIIGELLQQLVDRISVLRALAITREGRVAESLEEGRAIVEAVERRDGEAAARCATAYVRNACTAALEALAASEAEDEPSPQQETQAGARRD